jgi:energy-coupling factor transport system substrate-specific component
MQHKQQVNQNENKNENQNDSQNGNKIQKKKGKKLGLCFWLSIVVIFILTPATIFASAYFGDRKYYIASVLIMIYSMIPFFAGFEHRKPQARELVVLAVMCAMAVVARVVFNFAPNFKPIGGIIMITALSFGPQAGFMTGSISLLASNLFFGQGAWTPWQMIAYGLLGFITGYLSKWGFLSEENPLKVAIVGFVLMVFPVGVILDTYSVFSMMQNITWKYALGIYASGIPINMLQGTAVGLCNFFLTKPITEKLDRIKIKYGIME